MRRRPAVTPENFLQSDASFRLNFPDERWAAHSLAMESESEPGTRLGRFALSIVGPRVARAQIEPCIADMQHEYFEALRKQNKLGSWFALVRGTASVLAHIVRNISSVKFHFERRAVSALNMPERFSEASRLVGQMAYDHAVSLRQDHVSDDCLLLALIDYQRAADMLQQCGAKIETLRSLILSRIVPEPDSVAIPEVLPPCSGLGHTWLEAHWEANQRKTYLVEPEHLLVGLVRDDRYVSRAAKDLTAAGFVRFPIAADPEASLHT